MGRGADNESLGRIAKNDGLDLTLALQNHGSPTLIFDGQGQVAFSNGSAQKHFSCHQDDFLYLNIDDLLYSPYSILDLERKGQKVSHLLFKVDSGLETAVLATAHVAPGQHLWMLEKRPDLGRVHPMLSERERQILDVLADGANNGEIAYAFGIAGTTVQQHIASLKKKLEAATRAQVIERAIGYRLLHPRSKNEMSLIQEVELNGDSLAKTEVRYLDHNTVAHNSQAMNLLSNGSLEQSSLTEEIVAALETESKKYFVEKEVRLPWHSEAVIAEGLVDPLPGNKVILRFTF